MRNKLRDQKWYPYAVAACIAVAFYVVLANLGSITTALGKFLGYFQTIFLAVVIAYVMNPLAMMFKRNLFSKIKQEKFRWSLSIGAAVVLLLLLLGFLLRILIPQLMNSINMLVNNLDSYVASLKEFSEQGGLIGLLGIQRLFDSSDDIISGIQTYFTQNADTLVNASAAAGRSVVTWVIALILSIYMLSAKDVMKRGFMHLLSTLMPDRSYNHFIRFLGRCDTILLNYISASLLDAFIIGTANAIFMAIAGMQYIGLISVVVGVTNLIPTFGPIIGGFIGAVILLLVKPLHALIFVIFTFILQFIDPYFIKPRLFGNSLGVSGLLILMSVIICGRMFGIFGILISIPLAAILSFLYMDLLLPELERRAEERRKASQES